MIIDFHAHILPGMDHGCPDAATAERQLRLIRASGVDVVAATSHFYPEAENPTGYLARRVSSLSLLRKLVPEGLTVIPGAEVLVCEGMENMDGLNSLATGGTLLLEMPFTPWKQRLYETVDEINSASSSGCVLAHVDRYDPNDVERLFGLGLRGQLNASALCRRIGRGRLLRWVNMGCIAAIGSDLHGVESGCYSGFKKAISVLGAHSNSVMEHSAELLGIHSIV